MNSFSCTCVLSSDAVFDDLILSCTHVVSSDAVLDELAELFLVGVLVVVLQNLHVVADVLAEDVVAVHLGAEVAAFVIVAWETLRAAQKKRQTCSEYIHTLCHKICFLCF